MVLADTVPPTFERSPLVPVAAYLAVLCVLSALVAVSPTASPPPLLGMAWGVFLAALAVGASTAEGVSVRTIFPPVRSLVTVGGVLVAFWALYNLAALALAVGGVAGFDAAWSRAAAHPLAYLAALASSLLFTAVPEELFFRSYLQGRFVAMFGGDSRRTVLAGVAFGTVYALTGNLWLVALLHATMNYRPLLVSVHAPADLHLVVGVVEYAAAVSAVYLTVRLLDPDGETRRWTRQEATS